MEFRPFYLFVRHLICNLKIPLINSVITSFKVLNILIAGFRIFWWWIETEPCNRSILSSIKGSITARPYQWAQLNCDLKNAFIKARHLAMIMHGTSLASAFIFLDNI